MLEIKVDYDSDTECPSNYDCNWRLISFNPKHIHFVKPELDKYGKLDIDPELQEKIEQGFAFILSYYEHSGSRWSLKYQGPQCPWDTVQTAGLLIWDHDPEDMGAETYEERMKDANLFLDSYNDWGNGNCFWIQIKIDDKVVDSYGGYIGTDALLEGIKEIMDDYQDEGVKFTGPSELVEFISSSLKFDTKGKL